MERDTLKELIKTELELSEVDPIDMISELLQEISSELQTDTPPEDLVEPYISRITEK